MMNGDEARRFGEKSLADVQVMDLNSVLKSLRLVHPTNNQNAYFNIPPLDSLLPPPSTHPPILTLISPPSHHQPSGSGKTSLITLIIATALSTPSNAIILIDPLRHFNIPLLYTTLLFLLLSSTPHPRPSPPALRERVKNALQHVHIFHPQTYPSLLSTLRSLPAYLSNPSSHTSTHRTIHALILEDTHVFLPSLPLTSTVASASATLCFHLTNLARLLSCALVTSSCSTSARYYRPAMLLSWGRDMGEVRIALRKVEGSKVGAGMGVEEVEGGDKAERREWCQGCKVGSGNQEGGKGFVIKIGNGVEIEDK